MDGSPLSRFKQYLAATVSSLVIFCSGSSYVWPAPLISSLQQPGAEVFMKPSEVALMVAMTDFGNMLTPLPSAYLSDLIGRKFVLLACSPFYLAAGVIILTTRSVIPLYVMRFLQGLANGVVYTILPLYLGELAEAKLRGSISVFFTAFLFLGMLTTYVTSKFTTYVGLTWLITIEPVVFAALFVFMPETAHFYLLIDMKQKAAKSLMWFRGAKTEEEIADELNEIAQEVRDIPQIPFRSTERMAVTNKNPWKELLTTKIGLRSLALGSLVVTTQVLGGFFNIFSYATDTLLDYETIGIDGNYISMIFTVVTLIFTYVALMMVDVMGRRPMLLISGCVSFYSALLAATYFYIDKNSNADVRNEVWLLYTAMIVLAAGLNFAFGTLIPTLQAELFPTTTRSLASSIMATLQATITSFTLYIYIPIELWTGVYLNYFIFAFFVSLGTGVIYLYFPETKGKTFAQIQEMLT